MKKLLFFSILLFASNSFAQSRKMNLPAIIKELIPDSTGIQALGNWNKVQSNKCVTEWFGKLWCGGDNCSISGVMAVAPEQSLEGSAEANGWSFSASGPKNGYASFEISAVFVMYNGRLDKILESVFAGEAYKSILNKACKKYSYIIYTLQFPGKEPVWLKFMSNVNPKGNATTSFTIYLTANAKDSDNIDCK